MHIDCVILNPKGNPLTYELSPATGALRVQSISQDCSVYPFHHGITRTFFQTYPIFLLMNEPLLPLVEVRAALVGMVEGQSTFQKWLICQWDSSEGELTPHSLQVLQTFLKEPLLWHSKEATLNHLSTFL